MKKIILAIFFIFIAVVGVFGWNYYQDTYVGRTYYAVVPEGIEKVDIKSASGEVMGQGYEYHLTAVNEAGETNQVSFTVITEGDYRNGTPFEAGTFLQIEASKNRSLSERAIPADQVPVAARDILENQ